MLNVACVNAGNYLGQGGDYVAKLRDGIKRHLTLPYRFVCFTDDPEPIEGVEYRPIRPGIVGWWHKLELLAPGAFEPGEQVLFLDLDTVIVGNIDDIASYCGKFAICRDFYFPDHYGSCLMSWEAGTCDYIWTTWDKNGRPSFDPNGDQRWIESMQSGADLWQDMFPRQVVSYKADCRGRGLPTGARVCCFHGLPRPHMVEDEWVVKAWNGE